MSKRFTKDELIEYLSNFKKDETICLDSVKAELINRFNYEVPIKLIEDYFKEKGYNIQLNLKLENENKRIKESSPHFTALQTTIDSFLDEDKDDDEDEDFDPNVFINKNKDRINKKAIELSNFTDNDWIIKQYQKEKNVDILNELISNNRGLVEKIAGRYLKNSGKSLDFDDLVNEGSMGLMKAIDKFDISLGYQFSTYATWWIRQAITRAIVDKGYTIRVPVHMYESVKKVLKVESESMFNFNKIDSNWVSNQLNMTLEKYNEIKKVDYMYLHLVSLDSIVSEDDEDSTLINFIEYDSMNDTKFENEMYLNPEEMVIKKNLRIVLDECMEQLKVKEREVLKHRFGWYGEKKTLEEIGEIYKVTRERIRQIEAKALLKLRKILRNREMDFMVLI
ncbi:sigma-70 family RNA polymerase sigma factor [Rossellomorea sp. GAMAL-10_SWC]